MNAREKAEQGWVSGHVRESADGLGRAKTAEERAQANADRMREFQKQERQEQIGKKVKRGGRF